MLMHHKEKNAVCTVATIEVPIEDASRFGICNTDDDSRIYEFEEKPKHPKNNQASMGIYIFNTETLIKYLLEDDKNPTSSNDFGKDIIPMLLSRKERLYAYYFSGYWKDVGTIRSLWESNMDLICEDPLLNIQDKNFKIFSRNKARPPQYHGLKAIVKKSLISEGCRIYGTVENSILSGGVTVKEGAHVKDSVIMDDVIISEEARIYNSIIDSRAIIGKGAIIGLENIEKEGITVISKGVSIPSEAVIKN